MARFESTTVRSSDVPAATLPRTGGGRSTRRGADARGRRSRTARDPCLRRSRRRASFGERGGSDKNVSLEGWALYTCFAERTHATGRDQLSSGSHDPTHRRVDVRTLLSVRGMKKATRVLPLWPLLEGVFRAA